MPAERPGGLRAALPAPGWGTQRSRGTCLDWLMLPTIRAPTRQAGLHFLAPDQAGQQRSAGLSAKATPGFGAGRGKDLSVCDGRVLGNQGAGARAGKQGLEDREECWSRMGCGHLIEELQQAWKS